MSRHLRSPLQSTDRPGSHCRDFGDIVLKCGLVWVFCREESIILGLPTSNRRRTTRKHCFRVVSGLRHESLGSRAPAWLDEAVCACPVNVGPRGRASGLRVCARAVGACLCPGGAAPRPRPALARVPRAPCMGERALGSLQ